MSNKPAKPFVHTHLRLVLEPTSVVSAAALALQTGTVTSTRLNTSSRHHYVTVQSGELTLWSHRILAVFTKQRFEYRSSTSAMVKFPTIAFLWTFCRCLILANCAPSLPPLCCLWCWVQMRPGVSSTLCVTPRRKTRGITDDDTFAQWVHDTHPGFTLKSQPFFHHHRIRSEVASDSRYNGGYR